AERNGSSRQALKKYISANFKGLPEKFDSFFNQALKKAAEAGTLLQPKGPSGPVKINKEKHGEASVVPTVSTKTVVSKKPSSSSTSRSRSKRTPTVAVVVVTPKKIGKKTTAKIVTPQKKAKVTVKVTPTKAKSNAKKTAAKPKSVAKENAPPAATKKAAVTKKTSTTASKKEATTTVKKTVAKKSSASAPIRASPRQAAA
ncbi:hypothetical protein HK100_002060, partial [Physocladia obscura]